MELLSEGLIDDAVARMDASLGVRGAAEAISGRPVRKKHRSEDPVCTTYRILIRPYMEAFGRRYVGDSACLGESGMILCYVAMNRPLEDASKRMVDIMEDMSVSSGVSTDGFRWACACGVKPRIDRVFDLRPYYIEALDRRRFRVAVAVDRGELRDFEKRMRDVG